MSGEIESSPLPPPNYRTTITAADRPAFYQRIKRELDDLLNGASSYYPDGGQKDRQTLLEDLDGFIGRVDGLYPFVNDPSGVIPGVVDDLRKFKEVFEQGIKDGEPVDGIKIPDAVAPYSLDKGVDIGVNLEPPDPNLRIFPRPPDIAPFKQFQRTSWQGGQSGPDGNSAVFGQRLPAAVGRIRPGRDAAPTGVATAADPANFPRGPVGQVSIAGNGAMPQGAGGLQAGFRGLLDGPTSRPANADGPTGRGDYHGLLNVASEAHSGYLMPTGDQGQPGGNSIGGDAGGAPPSLHGIATRMPDLSWPVSNFPVWLPFGWGPSAGRQALLQDGGR